MKSSDSPEDPAAAVSEALNKEEHANLENRPIGALKSVLLLQKRKGPKKSLKWKTDLESIRLFELDETERANVTKTFTDAKQFEKQNEREAFHQMARKLSKFRHISKTIKTNNKTTTTRLVLKFCSRQ